MATSISPSTLTVTLSEQINLNNQPVNSENQLIIADVNYIDKRIMAIPTSEVGVITFNNSSVGAGTFVSGEMKYLRITNKDKVNYARLRVTKTSGDTYDERIDAGKSFLMGNTKINTSDTAAAFVSFEDADNIKMQAYDAAVDIEFFVASKQ